MKKLVFAGITALVTVLTLGSFVLAQEVQMMRSTPIDADNRLGADFKWEGKEGRMQRNYRQQPPLVPHSIAQYQIDTRVNQCLGCHDWTKAGARGAPTLSMTHYLDREGNELDHIAGTRFFCNQCHVPQADVSPLVPNVFDASSPIEN